MTYTSTLSSPSKLSKEESPQSKSQLTKGKPSTTNNINDINTKQFLAKTIDGLENSAIVDKSLTTKIICMMSSDCDRSQSLSYSRGFKIKKRRIEVEDEEVDEDDGFFRSSEELDAEINSNEKSLATRMYLGNLRKNNAAQILKNDFLCLIDGDHNGNLKEKKKQNFVFLKLLKCVNEEGKKQHLPICLKCNPKGKTQALIDCIWKSKISEKIKEDNLVSCTHADVGEMLWTKEDCKKENLAKANCKQISDDGKQHLAVSFDGNTHGLIFANLARGAKKGTCLKCKSFRCSHIRVWDIELKKKVIKHQENALKTVENKNDSLEKSESGDSDQVHDDYIADDAFGDEYDEGQETFESSHRLKYPFDKSFQDNMRQNDLSNYSDLTELISSPREGERCSHGHSWSVEDPRTHGWIYSKKIKIAHSNFVTVRDRTVFYRKTTSTCKCKLLYNGASDLLLPVSRGSYKILGMAVNLVSFSLLTDFLTEFFQNGTTMRGFFNSYQSKCTMKYGMEETDVISWKVWHIACVEFMEKIVNIDKTETFTCDTCGPTPKALVIDGIAMGMQISKLMPGEITKSAKQISQIEIPGSNFRDRMFIKLPSNRKLLREAAKKEIWPQHEDDQELQLKRSKSAADDDTGMELFWRLLESIDTKIKPCRGIILLMENLSTSSSTVGLMQIINKSLVEELISFLKGGKTFLRGTENLETHRKMRREYPVVMDILMSLCDGQGCIGLPVRSVFSICTLPSLQFLEFIFPPPSRILDF